MLSTFVTETIEGVAKLCQYITYNNGKKVKRIFAKDNKTPEDIVVIRESNATQSTIALKAMSYNAEDPTK